MTTVQEEPQVATNRRESDAEHRTAPPRPRPVEPLAEEEVRRSEEYIAAGYSGEAITAAGAVVLAIIGLAGMFPAYLGPIAVITVGAALLMKAGSIAARFSELRYETGGTPGSALELGTGMSAELAAGAAGIALGVLALLGLIPIVLSSAAVIVFGGALLFGGGETYRVTRLGTAHAHRAAEHAMRSLGKSSGAAETLVGIAAVVLGIIALTGGGPAMTLVLVALLALASAGVVSGIVSSGRMAVVLKS